MFYLDLGERWEVFADKLPGRFLCAENLNRSRGALAYKLSSVVIEHLDNGDFRYFKNRNGHPNDKAEVDDKLLIQMLSSIHL